MVRSWTEVEDDMQPLLLLEVAHMMYGGEGGQRLREGMQTLLLLEIVHNAYDVW